MLGFRYDETRRAYILRGIGDRFGPVVRDRPRHRQPTSTEVELARIRHWLETIQAGELEASPATIQHLADARAALEGMLREPFPEGP
jgi:hypothetical protein